MAAPSLQLGADPPDQGTDHSDSINHHLAIDDLIGGLVTQPQSPSPEHKFREKLDRVCQEIHKNQLEARLVHLQRTGDPPRRRSQRELYVRAFTEIERELTPSRVVMPLTPMDSSSEDSFGSVDHLSSDTALTCMSPNNTHGKTSASDSLKMPNEQPREPQEPLETSVIQHKRVTAKPSRPKRENRLATAPLHTNQSRITKGGRTRRRKLPQATGHIMTRSKTASMREKRRA